MRYQIYFLTVLFFSSAFANETNLHQTVSASLGMASSSGQETESNLSGPNVTAPTAVAASSINMNIVWEFNNTLARSFLIRASGPLLGGEGGAGLFNLGFGMNFYFNSISSKYSFHSDGISLMVKPKIRYYGGFQIGGGYLTYNTETSQKGDSFYMLGAQGGMIYHVKNNYGIKGELMVARGTGSQTSTVNLEIGIGLSYYLDK